MRKNRSKVDQPIISKGFWKAGTTVKALNRETCPLALIYLLDRAYQQVIGGENVLTPARNALISESMPESSLINIEPLFSTLDNSSYFFQSLPCSRCRHSVQGSRSLWFVLDLFLHWANWRSLRNPGLKKNFLISSTTHWIQVSYIPCKNYVLW